MLLKQEAALDMVSVGDVTSKLHRGMIRMKEKATVPNAHSRPTSSKSSVTGVFISP